MTDFARGPDALLDAAYPRAKMRALYEPVSDGVLRGRWAAASDGMGRVRAPE
jgi:hypothetical protein